MLEVMTSRELLHASTNRRTAQERLKFPSSLWVILNKVYGDLANLCNSDRDSKDSKNKIAFSFKEVVRKMGQKDIRVAYPYETKYGANDLKVYWYVTHFSSLIPEEDSFNIRIPWNMGWRGRITTLVLPTTYTKKGFEFLKLRPHPRGRIIQQQGPAVLGDRNKGLRRKKITLHLPMYSWNGTRQTRDYHGTWSQASLKLIHHPMM